MRGDSFSIMRHKTKKSPKNYNRMSRIAFLFTNNYSNGLCLYFNLRKPLKYSVYIYSYLVTVMQNYQTSFLFWDLGSLILNLVSFCKLYYVQSIFCVCHIRRERGRERYFKLPLDVAHFSQKEFFFKHTQRTKFFKYAISFPIQNR